MKDKVIEFLKANGWKMDISQYDSGNEFWSYIKDDSHIVVDISDDEMVFIGESGDFLHEKLNLYTLIGVLLYHRQLPISFKQP